MFSRSSCCTDSFLCASNKDSKYLDTELLSCHTSILQFSRNNFLLQRTHRNCIFSKWLAGFFLSSSLILVQQTGLHCHNLFLVMPQRDWKDTWLTSCTHIYAIYTLNATCFKSTNDEKILHVLLYDKKMTFHSSICSALTLILSALFKPSIFPIFKYSQSSMSCLRTVRQEMRVITQKPKLLSLCPSHSSQLPYRCTNALKNMHICTQTPRRPKDLYSPGHNRP